MTPATGFQRSVALASLARPDTPIFVEQFVLACPPGSGDSALRTAWDSVLQRHPGLSAQYDFAGTRLVYRQLPPWDGRLNFDILSAASPDDAERICADEYRPFAIGSDEPLWRAAAIDVGGTWWFCLTLHHLIFDDRSWRIIRSDFSNELRNPGSSSQPPSGAGTFDEFLVWRGAQRVSGDTSAREHAVAEWADLTRGLEGPTVLPSLAPNGEHNEGDDHGANLRFPVPLLTSFPERLEALRQNQRVTTNTVGLAAWSLVLSRLCRTDVVCFGQTRHGVPSDLPDAASIVGPMVDTLPFVVPVDETMSLDGFLDDVASRHRRMYGLAPLDASELVALAFVPGTEDVMSTIVNHVRAPRTQNAAGDRSHDTDLPIVRQRKSAALQPTLTVLEGEPVRFEIVTSAAQAEFGRLASTALAAVLAQFVEPPHVLADISTVPATETADTELHGLLQRYDASTLADLVEESLRTHAQRLALDGAERLTYAELDQASLSLAQRSGMASRAEQACVAVVLAPGEHALTAVVAAIRCGHCFICIDPLRPAAEVGALLKLIGPDIVIAAPGADPSAIGPWQTVTVGANGTDTTTSPPTPAPSRQVRPDDLAYLVATSGSTGVPKVVEIEQASAANAICSLIRAYGMTPDDRRLRSVSRPGADVFIAELLVPLCSGATLVEAIGGRPLVPAQFFELLERERITIAGAASSYLAELVESRFGKNVSPAPHTLRMMTTGTEVVDPSMVTRWRGAFGDHVTLLNVYGPAEATLVMTTCRLSDLAAPIAGPVPIGLPLPNTRVMLLDRAGHPVPRGAVGEICAAGAGVMRGYRGIETSTIIEADTVRGRERYYRTGDLGRIGPDGQLVFCGRSDRQVKIRGHRVELDGVEARLRAITGGLTVAAVVAERAGRLVLLAAVESDGAIDGTEIRARMAAAGSTAEVPAAVVALERLPRLANGKLDRRSIAQAIDDALPHASPDESPTRHDKPDAFPSELTASAMVSLWNELFEVDDCNVESDFFDLGGDSLLAVRLAAEIDIRFDLTMGLDVLYAARQLGALTAAVADHANRGVHDVIRPLAVGSGGTRMYFMHGGYGATYEWNEIAARLAGTCDCWGISGRVIRGDADAVTVDEACTNYANALASHCADEPFFLVGYSASGVLAYETARLAKQAGLPVVGVILLEARPGSLPQAVRFVAIASMIRRRQSTAAAVRWIAGRALTIAVRAFAGSGKQSNPTTVEEPEILPFVRLAIGHRPRPANLRIVLLETRDPGIELDLRTTWRYVSRRRVSSRVLDLDRHAALLEEATAPDVAGAIRDVVVQRNARRNLGRNLGRTPPGTP